MALFESNTSTVKGGEMTIISRATTIKGDIKLECNIYVAGKVEGNIESTALITVGENGQVIGSMKAKKIIISGLLNGKIETDELELISGGKVQGDIITKTLSIEEGAIFEGNSTMKRENIKIEKK